MNIVAKCYMFNFSNDPEGSGRRITRRKVNFTRKLFKIMAHLSLYLSYRATLKLLNYDLKVYTFYVHADKIGNSLLALVQV